MENVLEFKPAKCKDCYKCLRHCPVNAIEVVNHQAKIINGRCILCGTCTYICPQNAKKVHDSRTEIKELLKTNRVYASVAPSFASSFNLTDFEAMRQALISLGFYDAEETSVGATMVTEEYRKMLESGKYKNLIASACPSLCRLIECYYPEALKYLAPCDSPMVAHAKIIHAREDGLKVVFIGPCIAKKREAEESGIIDGVLTFEELQEMMEEAGLKFDAADVTDLSDGAVNRAKYYPITRGIIKSFGNFVPGYEYVAVDGTEKCKEVLANIDSLEGMFIELNSCEYACINGPCSLLKKGTAVTANSLVRQYAKKDIESGGKKSLNIPKGIDYSHVYTKKTPAEHIPSEEEIKAILAKTGKFKPEDELNCGACGYDSCRKKAWAVANGFADIEMCVPYMRKKAESMSYEIIQNMPNGIMVIDSDYRIREMNSKVSDLIKVSPSEAKGQFVYDYMDASLFILAFERKRNLFHKRLHISQSNTDVEMTIINLPEENAVFAVLKDVTEQAQQEKIMNEMRENTLKTTDEVIKKQMRVAQEIASVLGETVAETKVAIINLKHSLEEGLPNKDEKDDQ